MAGSPPPIRERVTRFDKDGSTGYISMVWHRFFLDIVKDVHSYTSHASSHASGGSDEVDGDKLDIDWNPTNYTPSTSPSEASSVDHLTAHLKGIDTTVGAITAHKDRHDPEDGGDPLDCAAAGTISPDDSAAEGSAHSFARSDHTHQITCSSPGSILPDDLAIEGTAGTFARSDHIHAITCSDPEALSTVQAGSEGAADTFARSDHRHAIAHAIADNSIVTIDDAAAAANEAAVFTANGLKGQNEAEFKTLFNLTIGTDVLAQQTIGIADNNLLEVDDADAAANDYAKFTSSGLAGRSYSEVLADLSGQAAAAFDWNSQNLTSVGTVGCGAISSTGKLILAVAAGGEMLELDDSGAATTTAANPYMNFRGASSDLGYIGYGSASNSTLYLWNSLAASSLVLGAANVTRVTIASTGTTLNTLSAGTADYNAFLVSNSGLIKYRTGAQVLADLSGDAAADFSMNTHKITNVVDPAANQDAATKKYVDDNAGGGNCSIKTGTYTGDGSTGQGITGVGFAPRYVRIWKHPTAEAQVLWCHEKLDQTWGDYATISAVVGTASLYFYDSQINSLDADGFTVDDDGTDQSPNANTVTYDYLALG